MCCSCVVCACSSSVSLGGARKLPRRCLASGPAWSLRREETTKRRGRRKAYFSSLCSSSLPFREVDSNAESLGAEQLGRLIWPPLALKLVSSLSSRTNNNECENGVPERTVKTHGRSESCIPEKTMNSCPIITLAPKSRIFLKLRCERTQTWLQRYVDLVSIARKLSGTVPPKGDPKRGTLP